MPDCGPQWNKQGPHLEVAKCVLKTTVSSRAG